MIDIVERLKFDAIRCELQFSKGVAGNITGAAAEIERLRSAMEEASTKLKLLYMGAGLGMQTGREALAALNAEI